MPLRSLASAGLPAVLGTHVFLEFHFRGVNGTRSLVFGVLGVSFTTPTPSPPRRAIRLPSPADDSSEEETGILQQLADLQVS